MALASDSILLTLGSGATLATHSPGGSNTTEHQITMVASASGHIVDSMPTYGLTLPSLPFGTNKYHWELFNHPSSGKTLALRGLWPSVELGVANAAIHPDRFAFYRTTALSSGGTASAAFESATTTLANFYRLNPGDASLSSHVSAKTTLTSITTGTYLWSTFISSMASVRTQNLIMNTHWMQLLQGINLVPQRELGQPVSIPPGQGLAVRQGAVNALGNIGWLLEFTIDP